MTITHCYNVCSGFWNARDEIKKRKDTEQGGLWGSKDAEVVDEKDTKKMIIEPRSPMPTMWGHNREMFLNQVHILILSY